MIVDQLDNAHLYSGISTQINKAFDYLQNNKLETIPAGKYVLDGNDLFAIVQEYDTLDSATEQMESHRKYIDVQYMIEGAELVGHALLQDQRPSKEYDTENDYMLFAEKPTFFTKMEAGTFMVFFPSDLHMPCIKDVNAARVKKIVIKVKI